MTETAVLLADNGHGRDTTALTGIGFESDRRTIKLCDVARATSKTGGGGTMHPGHLEP